MSTVFSLKSDDEFIVPIDDKTIEVFRYKGDVKLIGETYCCDRYPWDTRVYVGRGEEYGALEVFGTIIVGDEFEQLAKELKAVEGDPSLITFVNRLGLCIITENDFTFDVILISYHLFAWSNYAVDLPQDNGDDESLIAWVIADSDDDDESLIDAHEAANKELRRSLEEMNVELTACKKELEEKGMELTACKKELEWSKKIESLQSELMEKKDKEVETMKNQLLAFKDILRSLIDY